MVVVAVLLLLYYFLLCRNLCLVGCDNIMIENAGACTGLGVFFVFVCGNEKARCWSCRVSKFLRRDVIYC